MSVEDTMKGPLIVLAAIMALTGGMAAVAPTTIAAPTDVISVETAPIRIDGAVLFTVCLA